MFLEYWMYFIFAMLLLLLTLITKIASSCVASLSVCFVIADNLCVHDILQDGAHYMIYTPVDPLLFVAVKVSWFFVNLF